jgi:RHS repeat-associated protein
VRHDRPRRDRATLILERLEPHVRRRWPNVRRLHRHRLRDGNRVESVYDAEGRRVEIRTTTGGLTTVRTIRYENAGPVQELVAGAVVREYLTDETGAIVKVCDPTCAAGTAYLVVWNGHGDATGLWRIESSGALTLANSYAYSTWGTPTTFTHNGIADLGFRYLYVGRHGVRWDPDFGLSLHHMGARHYSPALGRFLQPDPSAAEANLYAYAANGPITKSDPTGRCWWCSLVQVYERLRPTVDWISRNAESVTRWLGIGQRAIAFCQRACLTTYQLGHILRNHSQFVSQATLRTRIVSSGEVATRFVSDRRIVPLIRQTIESPTRIRWETTPSITNGFTRAVVYARRSAIPTGIDAFGRPVYWVRVVVRNDVVVTAYPARQPFAQ